MDNERVGKASLALLAMQRYAWDQGVTAHAFIDLGERDVAVALAREAAYRQTPDGRTAVMGANSSVTDPCAPGESLVYAYKATGDEYFKRALDKLLEWALEAAPRNRDGILYHIVERPQIWSDSTYMLPPFLAAAGHPKEAVRQMLGYFDILFDPQKKLLHHIWDDGIGDFERAAFWGGGNGWALAGIARMLRSVPETMTEERRLVTEEFTELLDSALSYMRPDGLFHDFLDDESTFVETNFSQMCAYAIYTGVADGWLSDAYLPAADKMRLAANSKMDGYGLIQDACGAPTFSSPGTSPEAQAFYIMMEAAKG